MHSHWLEPLRTRAERPAGRPRVARPSAAISTSARRLGSCCLCIALRLGGIRIRGRCAGVLRWIEEWEANRHAYCGIVALEPFIEFEVIVGLGRPPVLGSKVNGRQHRPVLRGSL